jgi:hypothetical protein
MIYLRLFVVFIIKILSFPVAVWRVIWEESGNMKSKINRFTYKGVASWRKKRGLR